MAWPTTRELKDEERCTSPKSDGSGRCRKQRCIGLTVCETHGGKTPNAIVVRTGAKLQRELARHGYGNSPVDQTHEGANPISGLAWEIRRTAGNIEFLEKKLSELTDDELVWGISSQTIKRTLADELTAVLGSLGHDIPRISRNEDSHKTTNEEAALNMWASLYIKERKHYVELLKLAIGSGLENRRITIMEEHVLQFNDVLANVISKLGGNPDDPEIRALVRNELTALLPAPQDVQTELEALI